QSNNIACNHSASVDSTNNQAKNSLSDLSENVKIFITDYQTHGRGRGQNDWLTPGSNNSFLMSWVFKLPAAPQAITAPLIGLSLYRAASLTWPNIQWSIKPPNDLKLSNKKVAGLLIEAIQQGNSNFLIIGIGFNILSHPESLSEATHLNSPDGLKGQLKESELYLFLNQLNNEIQSALPLITHTHLTQESCQLLAQATGAQKVTPVGDLVFNDSVISWKEL
ncbi:MAG: hypothetical protein KDD40_12270, partial [Bdellovibrionales bacterium]|nr:hypothetical protein [Bdellovibrionales bacterium]